MNRCQLALILLIPIAVLTMAHAGAPRVAADEVGFSGIVTNLADDAPVIGARIGADGRWAITDADGRYFLPLPPGTYHVRAEADGFIGMTERYRRVTEAGAASLDVRMVPSDPSPEDERAIAARVLSAPTPSADAFPAYAPGLSAVTSAPETIRVLMSDGYAVAITLDEYLQGVVPREVPPNWPLEALKAQAVAARSYAATARRHASGDPETDAHVCTTTHCQVWSPTHYDTTDRAIADTRGIVATYDGAVISAYFHAHCDGHTLNVEDVWGGYVPYLRGVACPCGFDALAGHGIGLCQWGAKALAEQGRNYREILQHYYQGIALTAPVGGRVTGGSVTPASGDTNTPFVLTATYTADRDGLPAAAHAIIAGRSYGLQRISAAGVTPQVFQATVRLPAGGHTPRIYMDDGYGAVSTFDLSPIAVTPAGGPSPTPVAAPTEAVIVHSTPGDWAGGAGDGVIADPALGDGALRLDTGRTSGVYTSAVVSAPLAFIALGAQWHASLPGGASLAWEVRTRIGDAAWGEWTALTVEEDDGQPRTTAGADLLLGLADALQYRVTLHAASSGQGPIVENVAWICLDARDGPSVASLSAGNAAPSAEPPIIPRAAWGADESLMTRPPEYRSVRAVIVHHTVTGDGGIEPAAIVRAIYRYHAIHREKGDIGYNYLVDHLGNVYEGRYGGPGVVGSHAGYYDYGSLGVAVIGDHTSVPVPSPAMDALTRLLASRCAAYDIDPLAQSFFVTQVLPTIMGHRDCCATACPGAAAYGQLPALRSRIAAEMDDAPPSLSILSPAVGAVVRGVVAIRVQSTAIVSALALYVDGARVDATASIAGTTATAWWNTTEVTEGLHELRVVASNASGQGEATATVTVDHTPPANVYAAAPPWSRSPRVPFALSSADATSVQFSNGWIWEGEDLEAQVGRDVADAAAFGGQARVAHPEDGAGAWYGPYACAIPRGRSYEASFRLKTPARTVSSELALLDVSDSEGLRVHAQRSLAAVEFPREGVYDEFALPFAYPSDLTTCTGPARDGLEFRTWYRARGELSLDRVTLWSAPQPFSSTVHWTVRPQDGPQTVTVRFRDAAGNPTDRDVAVRIDSTPPTWVERGVSWATVRDLTSGLAPASAAYAISRDEGATWGAWTPITITASLGTTDTVRLEAPMAVGSRARFRIDDVAGNTAWSDGVRLICPIIARD